MTDVVLFCLHDELQDATGLLLELSEAEALRLAMALRRENPEDTVLLAYGDLRAAFTLLHQRLDERVRASLDSDTPPDATHSG